LDEDDNLVSKEYFLDEMVSLLGGRAAEELFIGPSKITTGASNDFERATRIASHMVMKYGMDEEMGPVVYREEEKGHYRPLSTATIEKADLIIKKLVMTAYDQAKKILSDNTVRINHIKDVLLDKEYLSKEEFEGLMVG
jgi:cell division protease FtsH